MAEKAAEKERIKAEEKRRKDLENARKVQAEEYKKAMAASKQTALEDEEKRRKEAAASGSEPPKENGHDKFGLGSLSRSHKGSKSMSRKSFGFLGGKSGDRKSTGDDSYTAVEGESGPPTPEKNSKPSKSRTSFGFGKKKSNLNQ